MTNKPATIEDAKRQAKLLRARLADDGITISHSKSLELIAQQCGYHDWNTMHASFGNCPARDWQPGDIVAGRYLSQPFHAEILSVTRLRDGWYRLTFEFDVPVDVVTFESFSNFRRRTTQVIGPDGMTREKTSDGRPHMVLEI